MSLSMVTPHKDACRHKPSAKQLAKHDCLISLPELLNSILLLVGFTRPHLADVEQLEVGLLVMADKLVMQQHCHAYTTSMTHE